MLRYGFKLCCVLCCDDEIESDEFLIKLITNFGIIQFEFRRNFQFYKSYSRSEYQISFHSVDRFFVP